MMYCSKTFPVLCLQDNKIILTALEQRGDLFQVNGKKLKKVW